MVSLAFDARSVAARGGVWTVLGLAGNVGPLLVVGATAFLLVPRLPEIAPTTSMRRVNAWMLLLHALLAASFTYVTNLTFGGRQAPPGPAFMWMLAWTMLGATTAASLLVAMVGSWRWLFHSLGRVVAAGGALGMAAWVGGSLSTELWAPLSRATFVLVALVLRLVGLEVYVDATALTIDLEGFAVQIGPTCSGFEGIGMYAVLMGGFLYQLRTKLRFPRALILVPLGMLLVWLGNALRIASLMYVGARIDPKIAIGSFHSKAGWVFFAAITLAIAAAARRASVFARPEATESNAQLDNLAAPLLLPLLTWIGVGLVTSMFSSHHDPLDGVKVIAALGVVLMYRKKICRWYRTPTAIAVVTGLLMGVIWLAIPFAGSPDSSKEAFVKTLDPFGYVSWVVLRCLGSVVVVPICEELAFRGYLARRLTRQEFWNVPFTNISLLGILGSAVIFGAVHDRWMVGTLAGLLYVWLVRRSGRLSDGVAAHALSNAVIAAWVLASGDWRYW